MQTMRNLGWLSGIFFALCLGVALGAQGCSPFQNPIKHGSGGGGSGTGGGGGGGDDGTGGNGGDIDLAVSDPGDGGSAYNADLAVNTMCVPPQVGMQCPNPIGANAGCKGVEDCGPSGSGNGLDDNCNGVVDEGCSCVPGAVEKCFLGPPGKRGVGGCTDGTATCSGQEFGSWGPCTGSIGPSSEKCDKLDNDCNGCSDDGLCCTPALDCPAPGDPRIAPKPPYTDVPLKGELFFPGMATSWSWKIVGGPCDQLFATTTTPVAQSFTLMGGNAQDATAHFTLSGDYTVTLTVVGTDGQTYTCTWVQHIVGPGVRLELCWDHSGKDDLDLHVHKPGTTTKWFTNDGTTDNPDDCYYKNCKADEYSSTGTHPPQPNWGYANSAIAECVGAPEGMDWQTNLNACHNPRLDIDNISTSGKPENINIDNPKDGDSFRAAVHYYTGNTEEHPLVNIYCGGNLLATYGKAPDTLTGFNKGAGYNAGMLWRVADVKATVDASGNTTGCTITQLHPPATPTKGYWVTTNGDMTY
jgi:hypothetical protein